MENELPVIRGPVIDYVYVVDEEEFPDGTDVVAQDKFGNWFWVILAGKMEVIRIFPEGGAPIVRLADGAYIGSIVSFLREGNVRSATVKALGNVQLGVLDSELISREYAAMTDELQSILISVDKRLRQVTDVCAKAVLKAECGF
jgi:CRP-like cAMP-binding protein